MRVILKIRWYQFYQFVQDYFTGTGACPCSSPEKLEILTHKLTNNYDHDKMHKKPAYIIDGVSCTSSLSNRGGNSYARCDIQNTAQSSFMFKMSGREPVMQTEGINALCQRWLANCNLIEATWPEWGNCVFDTNVMHLDICNAGGRKYNMRDLCSTVDIHTLCFAIYQYNLHKTGRYEVLSFKAMTSLFPEVFLTAIFNLYE